MKMMRSPEARAMPALRARDRPALAWLTTIKAQVARSRTRSITRGVSSVEPSFDEHDLVVVIGDGLFEAGIEHALEQPGAIVSAELNRRERHASSRLTAARIRGRSRCAMQA